MRVIHVVPTPFGEAGLFGGGERYPLELARALAAHVDCELVSFGRKARIEHEKVGSRLLLRLRTAEGNRCKRGIVRIGTEQQERSDEVAPND